MPSVGSLEKNLLPLSSQKWQMSFEAEGLIYLRRSLCGCTVQQLSKCHHLAMATDSSSSSHCSKTKPLLGGDECCLYAPVAGTCQLCCQEMLD